NYRMAARSHRTHQRRNGRRLTLAEAAPPDRRPRRPGACTRCERSHGEGDLIRIYDRREFSAVVQRSLMKRIRSAAVRPATITAMLASLALLAGCAGSVGGSGAGSEASAGEGFAADASQDEIDEALSDLDPVTLKFQPSAMSEKSILAPNGLVVKKAIEERSGGKITVDVVWGQAIASYDDVDDAL